MVGLITFLILIPLAGAAALYIGRPRNARAVALIFNALSAFYALMLWQKFDRTSSLLQAVERHAWIPSLGAEYLVGIDGLSLLLILLVSIVFPFAFSAQRLERIGESERHPFEHRADQRAPPVARSQPDEDPRSPRPVWGALAR